MRTSHQRCSKPKGVLKNFTKFTGKHLCHCLFFNKVVGLRATTSFKKRLCHWCFPVNFEIFLRNLFYRTHPDDCFCIMMIFTFFVLLKVSTVKFKIAYLKWTPPDDSFCIMMSFKLSVFLKVCTVKFKIVKSGLRQFLVTESPLEIMENASSQKLFSFSRHFNFCLEFFVT